MLNYHALNPATAMRPPTRAVHGGPSTPRVRGGALPYSSISALNSFPPLSTSVNYQNNLTPTSTPHYPLDSTSFVTTADTPLNGHTWAGGEGGEKQYFIPPPKILGTRALPSLRIPSFSFSTVIPYTTMNHSTPIYQASTSNARYDDWMSSYTATSYGSTIDKRPLSATRSTFDSRDSLPTTSVPFPTLVTRIPSKASVSPSILPLFVPSSISRHVDYEEGRDEDQEEEEDNSEGEIEDATVERRITVDARRDQGERMTTHLPLDPLSSIACLPTLSNAPFPPSVVIETAPAVLSKSTQDVEVERGWKETRRTSPRKSRKRVFENEDTSDEEQDYDDQDDDDNFSKPTSNSPSSPSFSLSSLDSSEEVSEDEYCQSPKSSARSKPATKSTVESKSSTRDSQSVGGRKKRIRIEDPTKKYWCTAGGCGAGFARLFNLTAHEKVHKGVKDFPCEIGGCDKSFSRKYDRSRHQWTIHKFRDS